MAIPGVYICRFPFVIQKWQRCSPGIYGSHMGGFTDQACCLTGVAEIGFRTIKAWLPIAWIAC
jgi:hypothetical protein